ncbi:hypothetical protein KZZ52_20780 [Dactylosporangium sp. AC04546]|uniref:hypothetical protein n=1 Tax=Dactylosporangium sp. AC04546 TaxID=2862460 RepID=UPI001EDE8B86|nr:hypothetical protein [Dactylosporangium sp. AC04546]WVK87725.1 hypothetical protein KZZ52_20780 [Dactylosporangium sp. AC04546]
MDKVANRIDAAGEDLRDDEARQKYLDRLIAEWQSVETAMRKAYFTLLLLAAAYALVRLKNVSELSLGPVKLSKVDPVRIFIPALMSYFTYQVAALFCCSAAFERVFYGITSKFHPGLFKTDLDMLMMPSANSILSPELPGWGGFGAGRDRMRAFIVVKNLVILALPFLLTILAGIYSVLDSGSRGLVFASLAVVVFFLGYAAVQIAHGVRLVDL